MTEVPLRILPIILSKGHSAVKGRGFENARVVGTVKSSLTIQAERNVDEVVLIDVQDDPNSRAEATIRNANLVADFLRIPFCVGGGLKTVEQVRSALRHGADKVLLGHSAMHTPGVITGCAEEFGSQAICVALDFQTEKPNSLRRCCPSALGLPYNLEELIVGLGELGAGEFLITVRNLDGYKIGPSLKIAEEVVQWSRIPVVYSGGVGSLADFSYLAKTGVSGIAAGAFFQFSQFSPLDVKDHLRDEGFVVRN